MNWNHQYSLRMQTQNSKLKFGTSWRVWVVHYASAFWDLSDIKLYTSSDDRIKPKITSRLGARHRICLCDCNKYKVVRRIFFNLFNLTFHCICLIQCCGAQAGAGAGAARNRPFWLEPKKLRSFGSGSVIEEDEVKSLFSSPPSRSSSRTGSLDLKKISSVPCCS